MADHAARIAALSAQDQELKTAFAALVRAFGGQEAVAAAHGVRQQKVSDWGNPRIAEFPPLDLIARLEACTVGHPGHPHVTGLMARRAGYLLVDQAYAEAAQDPAGLMQGLAAITAELGDVCRCVGGGVADGSFDQDERIAALTELLDLEKQVARLRVALRPAEVAETGRPATTRTGRRRG